MTEIPKVLIFNPSVGVEGECVLDKERLAQLRWNREFDKKILGMLYRLERNLNILSKEELYVRIHNITLYTEKKKEQIDKELGG